MAPILQSRHRDCLTPVVLTRTFCRQTMMVLILLMPKLESMDQLTRMLMLTTAKLPTQLFVTISPSESKNHATRNTQMQICKCNDLTRSLMLWHTCLAHRWRCHITSKPVHFRVDNAWYIVRFTEVGMVQVDGDNISSLPLFKTVLDLIFKNRLIASPLKTDGRSPHMFYLPYHRMDPRMMLGEHLYKKYFDFNGVSWVLNALWNPSLAVFCTL